MDRSAAARPPGEARRTGANGIAAALGLVVVIAAIGLRFWRIDWGLAANIAFPDELIFTARAAGFVPLAWSSFELSGYTYPPLYSDLAGLATAFVHAMGWIEAAPASGSPGVVLTARVVSAAIGVATVGIVYLLSRRMYSAGVARRAAAFMAVVPFHAMHAHIAATDVTLTAASALVLLTACELALRGSIRLAFAAGFSAALGTATKWSGLAMIVPVGWAILEYSYATRSLSRIFALGTVALATAALTFSVLCLSCVRNPVEVLADMQSLKTYTSVFARGFGNNNLTLNIGWYGRPYLYELCASLPYVLGWPLYLCGVVGVVLAARRRDLADRIVLATILPYFAFMGSQQVVFARYMMPILPGIVVLAARALQPGQQRWRISSALFAGVWLYTAVLSATQVARFSRGQQVAVAQWIAQRSRLVDRLLGKVHVAVPDFPLDYFGLARPLAKAKLVEVRVTEGHWFDRPAEFFVLPEWYATAIRRDSPDGPAAYELRRLESGKAGYHLVARWRSSFLQRDLYTFLDPAFAADLWQGEIDFSVFERAQR